MQGSSMMIYILRIITPITKFDRSNMNDIYPTYLSIYQIFFCLQVGVKLFQFVGVGTILINFKHMFHASIFYFFRPCGSASKLKMAHL